MSIFLLTFLSFLLVGCQRAPSFSLGGAYFPAWLVFALGAVVATLLLRLIFIRTGIDDVLRFKPLVYIALMIVFCLAALLFFFAR